MTETTYSTTLCTSFVNYYKTPLEPATIQLRLKRLKPLLDLRVPICIFAGIESTLPLEQYIHQFYNNTTHIHVIPLKKHLFEYSFLFQEIAKAQPQKIPKELSPPKDTHDYMSFLHTKIEFLKQAVEANPFGTSFYTWVDHNISQILSDPDKNNLPYESIKDWAKRQIGINTLPPSEFTPSHHISPSHEIYIPGCWKEPHYEPTDFYEKVLWRFCGGFLCARKEAILYLWNLYMNHFYSFLKEGKTMVWDVNFWAWLEHNPEIDWNPIWYAADHNDSIVKFPMFAQCQSILSSCARSRTITSKYIPYFNSSAVSMVSFKNASQEIQHVMNIRHVNYTYLPSGHCTIEHIENATCTRNMCTLVDHEHFYVPYDIQKTCFEVDETQIGLPEPNKKCPFQGIEDIRLFYHQHRVQFLATTVNYSDCNTNRIVIGDYDYHGHALRHLRVIQPPIQMNQNTREKNWIPIVYNKELYIVYSWCPFRIGVLEEVNIVSNDEDPQEQVVMRIQSEKEINIPLFREYEIRGSTNFVPYDGKLLGLVHFTVPGTLPKQYYHLLVKIDPETWSICEYTQPFYFDTYGVEFCIQMNIFDRKEEFVYMEDPMHLGKTSDQLFFGFYLSRQDRNPHQICFHPESFVFELIESSE